MKKILERIKERLFPTPKDEDLFPPAPNLDNLPEEYLRRFDLSPVQEPEQVLGRRLTKGESGEERELEKIEKALGHWKGRGIPLLLEAEPGLGVTSLLNAAWQLLPKPCSILEDKTRISNRQELLEALTQALEVGPVDSLEALAQVDLENPRVVIFENVERLLLRRIGGYDLIRDFLHFINATRSKVFWIVTINDYSLYFLNRALHFADNFLTLEVPPLSNEWIRKIILSRNEGFEMRFFRPEELSPRHKRQLAKMDGPARQAHLEKEFFEQLVRFAGGNISRAIVFWLSAARGVKEGKVYLKAPRITKPQEVRLEELLALEAVFQHTSLSFGEVEEIFRYSSHNGRLLLDRLLSRGWLYPRGLRSGVQEYQVNFWYLHELKQLLKDKLNRNIL